MESLTQELTEFAEDSFRGEAEYRRPPKEFVHLWEQFQDINAWRKYDRTENCHEVLSLETIAIWAAVTGTELTPFILEVFSRLEAAFWSAQIPKSKPGSIASRLKAIQDQDKRTVSVNPKKAK